jgi:beta-glucosidase
MSALTKVAQHPTPSRFQAGSETEQRIDELLGRMTLEEKVGQMVQLKIRFEEQIEPMRELIRGGHVGSMIMKIREPEIIAHVQRAAAEESRLGIPLLIASDVLHGYRTSFPIPLAEASTWDPALIERTHRVAAAEASASGYHLLFAPMLDVARDSRWGRQVEGAGEDPYLGTAIARARVGGYRYDPGDDRARPAACPKHFAAYGEAEAGIDYNTVEVSEATLRDVYLPPFAAAVECGAPAIMCAFNEINGIPATAHRRLLHGVLRDEWGFEGFVISDYNSIDELVAFGVAADRAAAAVMALEAGVDMDMGAEVYRDELARAVRDGRVDEGLVDQAVRRVLRVKCWCRLFEHPYPDVERSKRIVRCEDHLGLARETARRSIVLLENREALLPLTKEKLKKIAVVGPFADAPGEEYLGRWHCAAEPEEVTTILAGIRAKLGEEVQVLHEPGCGLTDEKPLDVDDDEFAAKGDGARFFASDEPYRVDEPIRRAVAAAQEADVAFVVIGQIARASGEGSYCHTFDLPTHQQRLLEAVVATGTPTVLLLVGGRVMSVRWAKEHVATIVQTWQLGTEAGHAVADVLFGDANPSGRLPITATKYSAKEPVYYNYKRTGRPKHRYFDYLWPFGYGLSYTEFEYADLQLSADRIATDEALIVRVRVRNTGERAGEETVQLYIRDEVASMTRPIKTLLGFEKVLLEPGQSETVELQLRGEELGFHDNAGAYRIEPGRFTLWVGPHSQGGLDAAFELVESA